jgi:hypothetical protein
MPCRLTSDKGSSLISKLIEDFTALVGTEHVKALATSKEEMAIVERLNREVMRHLRNIVFDRQLYDNWSLMLPFTNRILNSTIHSSTGMSPAEIIFGSSLSLNRGILAPLMEKEMDTKSISRICGLLNKLSLERHEPIFKRRILNISSRRTRRTITR